MKYFVAVITLVILMGIPVNSFSSAKTNKYFSLYGGIWSIDNGEASFKISFPISGVGTGYSELEWKDLDSLTPMIGAKIVPYFYFLSLDIQYAGGNLREGDNTDTDWIGGYFPFSVSKADTDGDVKQWSIDMDILLYPYRGKPTSWGKGDRDRGDKEPIFKAIDRKKRGWADDRTKLKAVIGYFNYEYSLRDTNGVQTSDPLGLFGGTGPFSGLNSTFDFQWKGIKTGLGFEHDFIQSPSKGLHAFGFNIEYAFLWEIDYTGKGYWNLRDLRFTQEADNGTGYDFLIYLFYNPLRNFQVQLGYRSLHVEAKDGLDLRSGVKNADLDKAESSSAGWLLNLAYTF